MEKDPFDRSVNVLARAAGRRSAMRAAGALGMAALAALGFAADDPGRPVAESALAAKRKKKKKKTSPPGPAFTAYRVTGPFDSPLGADTGSFVTSVANCGEPGKLLGCSYEVHESAANKGTMYVEAVPDFQAQRCTATLWRTQDRPVAGGAVYAHALCRA